MSAPWPVDGFARAEPYLLREVRRQRDMALRDLESLERIYHLCHAILDAADVSDGDDLPERLEALLAER